MQLWITLVNKTVSAEWLKSSSPNPVSRRYQVIQTTLCIAKQWGEHCGPSHFSLCHIVTLWPVWWRSTDVIKNCQDINWKSHFSVLAVYISPNRNFKNNSDIFPDWHAALRSICIKWRMIPHWNNGILLPTKRKQQKDCCSWSSC